MIKNAILIFGLSAFAALTLARSASAEAFYVGEITANGGTISAIDGSTITVTYDITKMTYIDSYYNDDNIGAATTVKNVVNGSDHTGGSMTRTLIGFSSIDSLSGYATSSVILNLACTRNINADWSVRAYALTQSWTEGTSVSGGQTRWGLSSDGATWSTSDGTTPWINTSGTYISIADSSGAETTTYGGGGAFDSAAYADADSSPVEGEWTTVNLTDIWTEASLYGVAVMNYSLATGVTEDQSSEALASNSWVTIKFASDEWVTAAGDVFSDVDASPYLTVTYTVVPEPATLTAFGAACLVGLLRRRKRK